MAKKFEKTLLIVVMFLSLAACESSWKADICYRPTYLKADNVSIKVKEGFILNQGHQYDVVETESGYDLVLHFVKG